MAITFTEADKARCRHHLGYLTVEPSAAIQLGFPSAGEAQFLVERAMQRIMPAYQDRVIKTLDILDSIECQMVEALCRLKAIKLGEITISNSTSDPTEQDRLEVEYLRWARRLADDLGVPLNVFSERFRSSAMGINRPVAHGA